MIRRPYCGAVGPLSSGSGGSVLVAALWLVALLGLIGLSVSSVARESVRLTDRRWKTARRNQEAKRAVLLLENILAISTASVVTAGDLSRWSTEVGGGVSIWDESARLNLNTTSTDTLRHLLGSNTAAAGLGDWRDTDDRPHFEGAEKTYYASLGRPYPCRNGRLASVEELLLIKGVTPALYERVKERVTVWGDGKINLNTVSSDTLRDLGFSAGTAEKVAAFRRGPDDRWGTADDGVFQRRNDAPDFLPDSEVRRWNALAPLFAVRGSAYRLDFPASEGIPRLRVVVTTDGKGIGAWREGGGG